MSDLQTHLGSIWYHSEPLEVPYFPYQFLSLDFFCRFLQQTDSNFSTDNSKGLQSNWRAVLYFVERFVGQYFRRFIVMTVNCTTLQWKKTRCPMLYLCHWYFREWRYSSKPNIILQVNRDWFPKFANGLNIKIDIVHKVYEWPRCLFVKMTP